MKLYKISKGNQTSVYFCYAKNAKKESSNYESVDITNDELNKLVNENAILDFSEYSKKHPGLEFNLVEDIVEVPTPDLETEIKFLRAENERLKSRTFDFKKMQEFYTQKALLFKDLEKFEANKKKIIEAMKLIENEDVQDIDTASAIISLEVKSDYRPEKVFRISNRFIILQIINDVCQQIDLKTENIRTEIAKFDI